MNITLKQLKVFIETAQEGSVSAAARKCSMSQPAASNSIAQLEKTIGLSLFDRFKKEISLNSDGKAFLSQAIEIVERASILENFNNLDNDILGKITVIANSIITDYVMPEIMIEFNKSYSNIDLELRSNEIKKTLNMLQNQECDLAFIEACDSDIDDTKFDKIKLKTVALLPICSMKHKLASSTSITADEICKYSWVRYNEGMGARDIFVKEYNPNSTLAQRWIANVTDQSSMSAGKNILLKDTSFIFDASLVKHNKSNIKVSAILPSIEAVKNYVINSDYITNLSETAIKDIERNTIIKILDLKDITMTRNQYLVLKKGRKQSRATKIFCDWLSNKFTNSHV